MTRNLGVSALSDPSMMRTRLVWLAAAVLHSACTSPAVQVAEPVVVAPSRPMPARAPLPVPDGLVLLRADATLRAGPADDAQASELFALAVPNSLRPAMVARVVDRVGAYWGVSTKTPEHGCLGTPVMFWGLELTVWVHERDLANVLIEPVRITFDAGTEVELAPGVPVGPPTDGLREVAVDGFDLRLAVPPSAIGHVYQPGVSPEAAPTHLLPHAAAVSLGAEAKIQQRPNQRHNGVPVQALSEHDDITLVELSTLCVRLRAFVPSADLAPLSDLVGHGWGTACGGFVTGHDVMVAHDAPAYWTDGRHAGAVGDRDRPFHVSHEERSGDRRCFKLHPTERVSCGSSGKHLSVCFDAADVTLIKP